MKSVSFRPASSHALKVAVGAGAFSLLVGVAHGLAYFIISDAVWSGPVGLRKPAVFGVSIAVTLWTLVWVAGVLRSPPRLMAWVLHLMSASLLIELVVIAGQRARGTASHFNLGTPFDAALWSLMGAAIGLFTVLAVIVAFESWRRPPEDAGTRAAVRAALLLFVLAQGSGQILAVHGTGAVLADGAFDPARLATASTWGTAGDLKLPHAIGLHLLQVLPLLAGALRPLAATAVPWIWTGAAGGFGVFAVMQGQALLGRAPGDLSTVAAMLLGGSLAALVLPWIVAGAATLPRVRLPWTKSIGAHHA